MKVKLKPGDLVYRVTEYDRPEGQHTWQVVSVKVKSASDRQIILATYFTGNGGTYRTRYTPDALGRLFFATPAEAVKAFINQAIAQIARSNREITEASRAQAWAQLQLVGVKDAG